MIPVYGTQSEAAARFVDGVTELAHTTPGDRVTILGDDEVELVSALANRGFAAVKCCGLASGPQISRNSADVVLAPTLKDDADFGTAAADAKRALKKGGVFVAELPETSDTDFLNLLDVLSLNDFTDISKRDDPSGLQILCCRKLAA
jgi:hypothetical protein